MRRISLCNVPIGYPRVQRSRWDILAHFFVRLPYECDVCSATFPWLRRLALPSGSSALTQDDRHCCIIKFNLYEVKRSDDIKYTVIERAPDPTLLNCSCDIAHTHADTCSTVPGSIPAGGYTQVPHRFRLYRHGSRSARPCARHIGRVVCAEGERLGRAHVMHSRSRITVDSLMPIMPRRSTLGVHRPGRHRVNQAQVGTDISDWAYRHVHVHEYDGLGRVAEIWELAYKHVHECFKTANCES